MRKAQRTPFRKIPIIIEAYSAEAVSSMKPIRTNIREGHIEFRNIWLVESNGQAAGGTKLSRILHLEFDESTKKVR